MKLYVVALCLSLLQVTLYSMGCRAVKSKAKAQVYHLRYLDIFELAFIPMDFTWSRTKDDDGDLHLTRQFRTVPLGSPAGKLFYKIWFWLCFL